MKYDKKTFKVVFTKGTGPGGQHRNKVETACSITHKPTGIVQYCQKSRSKEENFQTAFTLLIKRLSTIERLAKHTELNNKRKEVIEGGVIRTYNFQRHEVKDHRTKRTAPIDKVLNGEFQLLN